MKQNPCTLQWLTLRHCSEHIVYFSRIAGLLHSVAAVRMKEWSLRSLIFCGLVYQVPNVTNAKHLVHSTRSCVNLLLRSCFLVPIP